MNDKPLILFIDDEPEQVRPFAREITDTGNARAEAIPPGDIDDALLKETNVILIDLSLDKWDGPTLPKLKKPAVRGSA